MPILSKVIEESNPSNTGVTSLNGEKGAVSITAGSGVTVTPAGQNIAIAAPNAGVSSLNSESGAVNIVAGANVTVTPAGQNITISSSGGSGEYGYYDYLVYYDGAYYRAVNWLGNLVYGGSGAQGGISGVTSDTVVNAAITAGSNNVIIEFKTNTTYTQTAPFNIVGTGSNIQNVSAKVCLWSGGYSTIFNMTAASTNSINLSNWAVVDIQNLKIVQPDTNSGYGIYGDDGGSGSKECCVNSWFDRILIHGCDSTHSCMWLKNPFYSDFGWIFVSSINGNGVTLDATDTGLHVGNCHFRHVIGVSAASASYIFTVQSLPNSCFIDLVTIDKLEGATSGGVLHLKTTNSGKISTCSFNHMDLEGATKQVFIDPVGSGYIDACHFQADYMSVNAGQIALDLSAANSLHMGNVFDINCASDGSSTILNDGQTGYATPNEYFFNFGTSAFAPTQITIGSLGTYFPKIRWIGINGSFAQIRNPNSGAAAAVADGGTITHNLGITPLKVHITGTVASQEYAVTSTSLTTFTVSIKTLAGTSGTTQTIYWDAGWYSD